VFRLGDKPLYKSQSGERRSGTKKEGGKTGSPLANITAKEEGESEEAAAHPTNQHGAGCALVSLFRHHPPTASVIKNDSSHKT